MHIDTANEVIACLGKQRTLFKYYKDRYSIGLLHQYVAKRQVAISELKQSPIAQLTQKPRVKHVLANLGKQPLDRHYLNVYDYDEKEVAYTLTLGLWGSDDNGWRYNQTSRRGYNLVLQLNFNNHHDHVYRQLDIDQNWLNSYGHPTAKTKNTLAWARIDFDWQSNCALIEEIQSDCIRSIAWLARNCLAKLNNHERLLSDTTSFYGIQCPIKQTLDYCQYVLSRYQNTWAESMLWAATDFLWNEIGIHDIFYHSEASGKLMKNIDNWGEPPQSIYTDLPKKFCFRKTKEIPDFIAKEKSTRKIIKRHKNIQFQKLSLAS